LPNYDEVTLAVDYCT